MQTPVVSHVPHGVGCPPPPGMDACRGRGRLMCIKVRMLDDSVAVFHLGHKATGEALFDEVTRHLNILEADYFGLEFIDSYGNRCWLDKDKSILRQITSTQSDARFYFSVKFYTPDPAADLEEEYTRYLFALQIRRDLAHGEMICNENTAALLVSLVVQAECGDFSAVDYPDHTYLSAGDFVPNQTPAFQEKVMENHRKLIGMSPADADTALLETARRCDFYGIKLSEARDIEGTDVSLAAAHMGIKVFHQLSCISTFSWAKIRKLSFKRRHLMLKLHLESYVMPKKHLLQQYYKETIEFVFENRNDCKHFWKRAVEHHAFFRCMEPVAVRRKQESKLLFSRGSSFCYSGKTQKQLFDFVREHRRRREPFQRSLRVTSARQLHNIQVGVNNGAVHLPIPTTSSAEWSQAGTRNGNVYRSDNHIANGRHTQVATHYMPSNHSVSYSRAAPRSNGRPVSVHQQMGANEHDYRQLYQERMCASDMESSMHVPLPPPSRQLHQLRNHHHQHEPQHHHYAHPTQNATVIKATANQVLRTNGEGTMHAAHAIDPMTMSLPNVLGAPVFSHSAAHHQHHPGHSMKASSGENLSSRDDVSKCGSYIIGRNGDEVLDYDSSQSDVGSSAGGGISTLGRTDPRIYSTNFTTRRVGNVVVKRVVPASTSSAAEGTGRESDAEGRGGSRDSNQETGGYYYATSHQAPTQRREDMDCVSSVSAPGSAGKRRYMAVSSTYQHQRTMQQHQASGGTKIRTAVPVPIDGPHATPVGSEVAAIHSGPAFTGTAGRMAELKTANIIRPVVLPTSSGSESPSSSSTILRRPVVIKCPTSAASTLYKGSDTSSAVETSIAITATSSQASSTSLVGAVLGNSDNSESVELDVREATLKPTPRSKNSPADEGLKVRGQKPSVPPKPKDLEKICAVRMDGSKTAAGETPLLEPFDSILHDAKELSELMAANGDSGASKSSGTHHPSPPTSIFVESEDRPDLKTMHLFSGEPTVPYTLTIRNVRRGSEEAAVTSSSEQRSASCNPKYVGAGNGASAQLPRLQQKRKSLELVLRKQLPPQDSFSAEDHSISPTNPVAGNVLEYVANRQRSLSSDRSSSLVAASDGGAAKETSKVHSMCTTVGATQPMSPGETSDPLPEPPTNPSEQTCEEEHRESTNALSDDGVETMPNAVGVKSSSKEGILLETDF